MNLRAYGLCLSAVTAMLATGASYAAPPSPNTCPDMLISLENNTRFTNIGGAFSGYGNGNSTGWSAQSAYSTVNMTLGGFTPTLDPFQVVADIQWYMDNGEWKHANYRKCEPSPVSLPHKRYCPSGERASVRLVVSEINGEPYCALVATGR